MMWAVILLLTDSQWPWHLDQKMYACSPALGDVLPAQEVFFRRKLILVIELIQSCNGLKLLSCILAIGNKDGSIFRGSPWAE